MDDEEETDFERGQRLFQTGLLMGAISTVSFILGAGLLMLALYVYFAVGY